MPPVPVSSTDLRRDLARNTAPVEFLGAALLNYIREEGLYRGAAFTQGA
jgi:nicotinic acid mononucleotide adenylyltransferase